MTFRPLEDRVLLRRITAADTTPSGLFIPDVAKDKPQEAKVIAVGTGRVLENGAVRPLSVAVGDRVLFGKYAGVEITMDDVEHLILKEGDLLGVLA